MDDRRLVKVSKYLAKHLRHSPERLGITLDPQGWVAVDTLLEACQRQGFALTRDELDEVVRRNDKHRYAYDATGTRIRASQGHSAEVDLGLPASQPPALLYHGTAEWVAGRIAVEGLRRMRRRHVHLSADRTTARAVGARHGAPVVFEVEAGAMWEDGYAFVVSDNGVWLTEAVPREYLRRMA